MDSKNEDIGIALLAGSFVGILILLFVVFGW